MFDAIASWVLAGVIPVVPSAEPTEAIASRPYGNVMGDGLGLGLEQEPLAGGVCAPGETVFGIDVSYYQGDIDWPAVAAAGVRYAIVRVSHSTEFFDPQFYANLDGARAAGIHTGVYQYFEPDEDPIAQADLLLDALGPLEPGDLPPMIDVESTAGQSAATITNAMHAWIDRVEGELGVEPIIYTGYYFWQDNVASTDFGAYPLFLPWYQVECPGGVPVGWNTWTFHQYCDCGSVGGISGPVDVDNFNGSLADLAALAAAPMCGDGTCSGLEDPYTCRDDCAPCGVIEADGGTLDNGDACYGLYGNDVYWREEPTGEGGSLVWTHATDLDIAYNYAIWQLFFAQSGLYDLQVHVAQPHGKSTQAAYQVRHAGGETAVVVDQSVHDGWVSLGEFQFDAATDHTVRLNDNTGESPDAEVRIVYDALRVVRLDGVESDTGGGGSEGDEDSGPAEPSSTTDGDGGTGVVDPDGGAESDGTTGGPGATGVERSGGDEGCGCQARGRGGYGGVVFAWLPVVALRRRRRR